MTELAEKPLYQAVEPDPDGQPEEPREPLGWREMLALTIASYEVLFPILFAGFAVVGLVVALFYLIFS